jgi:hypothetical protein
MRDMWNKNWIITTVTDTWEMWGYMKRWTDEHRVWNPPALTAWECCKVVPLLPLRVLRGTLHFTEASGQRHAPAALCPPEWTPSTHWIGGWVASQLDCTQRLEKKYFSYAGDRNPVVNSVARHYTDWATAAPVCLQDLQLLCNNITQNSTAMWKVLLGMELENLPAGDSVRNWQVRYRRLITAGVRSRYLSNEDFTGHDTWGSRQQWQLRVYVHVVRWSLWP